MFAGFQDEVLGVIGALAGDFGEFIDREVGQVVTGVHTRLGQFGNQGRIETGEVAQILRNALDVLFTGAPPEPEPSDQVLQEVTEKTEKQAPPPPQQPHCG